MAPTQKLESDRDSLRKLIENISPRCLGEYARRLELLLKIESNSLPEPKALEYYYFDMLSYIEDEYFVMLMDSVHEKPLALYEKYFTVPELYFGYTNFTKALAKSIAAKKNIDLSLPACNDQTMILQAYAGYLEPFTAALKDRTCTSALSKYYARHVNRVERRAKVDAAFIVGTWMPYGNANTLGTHPSFGFLFGFSKKRMMFDMVMEFRTGKPNNSYQVMHQGLLVTTDHYFGGYFGVDVGYEFMSYGRSRFYFMTGIAADGFDSIEPEEDQKGKSFFVLNLNAGAGWKLFTRDGSYVGLDLRHNWMNYENTGGTPLDGNAVTLRLLYGIIKNDKQKRELLRLQNVVR